ncbi:MAG TPA: hypothetical protein DD454_00780 [Candidatus Moranbacteria bacterium]|nr:hypothetical protein [Candidatus Moranbacteria bacterium]
MATNMKISVAGRIKDESFAKVSFKGKNEEGCVIVEGKNRTLEIKLPEKINWRQATLIPRQIVFFAKKNGIKKLALDWTAVKDLKLGEESAVAEIFAVNFEMANYEFVAYKETPKEGWKFIEEILIIADGKAEIEKSIKRGQLIGKEINSCRDISNTPSGEMTPEVLAKNAQDAAKGTGIKVSVLREGDMKKMKMEAVLAVGKGSRQKPRFIVMEYNGEKKGKPVVLIGKGVTFDSGGISIKPADGMPEMIMDMSGGASVIHTVALAAKLGIKKRVIGLIPAVENMPSGESYRPGDIIRSMSGKTIEVENTDAEGRIILADANTYAEKYEPELVVNVATLTGAAVVALGERASAFFTKDDKLKDLISEEGEKSGEYVWQLPLWDEYEAEIKGRNADVCNTRNRANSRYGGSILGAMFIYQFSKNFPSWVHIDIAPRMTATQDEFLSAGATGTPIRLLIRLLEKY